MIVILYIVSESFGKLLHKLLLMNPLGFYLHGSTIWISQQEEFETFFLIIIFFLVTLKEQYCQNQQGMELEC